MERTSPGAVKADHLALPSTPCRVDGIVMGRRWTLSATS